LISRPQEVGRLYAQGFRQLIQSAQREIFFCPLNSPNVCAMKVAFGGEFFL
jgi:hypothetical protein